MGLRGLIFFNHFSEQANGKGAEKSYLVYLPYVVFAGVAIGAQLGGDEGAVFGVLATIAVGVCGALILDSRKKY